MSLSLLPSSHLRAVYALRMLNWYRVLFLSVLSCRALTWDSTVEVNGSLCHRIASFAPCIVNGTRNTLPVLLSDTYDVFYIVRLYDHPPATPLEKIKTSRSGVLLRGLEHKDEIVLEFFPVDATAAVIPIMDFAQNTIEFNNTAHLGWRQNFSGSEWPTAKLVGNATSDVIERYFDFVLWWVETHHIFSPFVIWRWLTNKRRATDDEPIMRDRFSFTFSEDSFKELYQLGASFTDENTRYCRYFFPYVGSVAVATEKEIGGTQDWGDMNKFFVKLSYALGLGPPSYVKFMGDFFVNFQGLMWGDAHAYFPDEDKKFKSIFPLDQPYLVVPGLFPMELPWQTTDTGHACTEEDVTFLDWHPVRLPLKKGWTGTSVKSLRGSLSLLWAFQLLFAAHG